MPLPTPNEGEDQDHWISRCMANPTMNEEYEDAEQRLAVCYSQWRNKMNDKMKRFILSDLKFVGEQGEFRAVFATLNVVDADGDLTLPGAFGKQDVILSQYNHGSWGSGAAALPIGVGKIFEEGDNAIIEGEFNLESEDALKTYQTLKYLYEKKRTQEWSYALPDIDYEMREEDGQRVRVLKRIRVNEVSPVLMGSGVDTRLLTIKEKGKRLIDDLKDVCTEAARVVERLKSVKEMREKQDRDIAETTIEGAVELADTLHAIVEELEMLKPKHVEGEMMAEFLRFQKIIAERREKDGTKSVSRQA